MSTTRKIEGFVNSEHINEPHPFVFQRQELGVCTEIPAILIIGGKGYTEDEVRAILQAMLDDPFFMNGGMDTREEKIMHIAKAHGITL